MGKVEETMEAYYGKGSADDLQEKVIVEKDKMGLAQALMILHGLLDRVYFGENVEEAFQVVFECIDNMVILLKKSGGNDETAVDEAGLADAPGADQDDRSSA